MVNDVPPDVPQSYAVALLFWDGVMGLDTGALLAGAAAGVLAAAGGKQN